MFKIPQRSVVLSVTMVSVRTRSVTVTKAGLVPSVISCAVIIAAMVLMVSVTTVHVTVDEAGMENIVP